MSESTRLLSQLSVGDSARVVRISGDADIRGRLLEMGLTTGVTVRMVRAAPLGDPIELLVRGYHLSVRKSEAAAVEIEGA